MQSARRGVCDGALNVVPGTTLFWGSQARTRWGTKQTRKIPGLICSQARTRWGTGHVVHRARAVRSQARTRWGTKFALQTGVVV